MKPKRTYRKNKPGSRVSSSGEHQPAAGKQPDLIRLNKYIAGTGLCSRRDADKLIASGAVSVNGKTVSVLGSKISPTDSVKCGNETLKREKTVYVLLNKPKDHITTTDDPGRRKTVLQLVSKACRERIYPVGRLDRNSTGVLLLTNDGELTKKLTHPKHGIRKIYHVVTDKNVKKEDLQKLLNGITLEDGIVKAHVVSYVGGGLDKKQIGIELRSGKNRVIRRMFEKLGYRVKKLDRVSFAGLTKKGVPRGRWRHLTEKEAGMLMML